MTDDRVDESTEIRREASTRPKPPRRNDRSTGSARSRYARWRSSASGWSHSSCPSSPSPASRRWLSCCSAGRSGRTGSTGSSRSACPPWPSSWWCCAASRRTASAAWARSGSTSSPPSRSRCRQWSGSRCCGATSPVAIETGIWVYSWVVWVEFFLMLAGVVLTVCGAVHPAVSPRTSPVAARSSRTATPARSAPVSPRPPRDAPRPAAAECRRDPTPRLSPPAHTRRPGHTGPYGSAYGDPPVTREQNAWAPAQTRDTFEPRRRGRGRAAGPRASRRSGRSRPRSATWSTTVASRSSGSGRRAWALVLEDRGEVFVVRHEDGRVGYLHDVSGVTRG